MKDLQLTEDDLHKGANALGSAVASPVRFGWRGKSVGGSTHDGKWIRVVARTPGVLAGRVWFGEEAASSITGVAKPALLRSVRWVDDAGNVWRADLFTTATDPVLSATQEIYNDPQLPESWWNDLARSLATLAIVRTDRVSVRQDLVSRRVRERFGDHVDATITKWVAAHGDLHWANLCGPRLCILDWEGWGIAPSGCDAAFLYAFSSLVPGVAGKVKEYFGEQLWSRDGLVAQLFVVAELLRMVELHDDHPSLAGPLQTMGETAMQRLRG